MAKRSRTGVLGARGMALDGVTVSEGIFFEGPHEQRIFFLFLNTLNSRLSEMRLGLEAQTALQRSSAHNTLCQKHCNVSIR